MAITSFHPTHGIIRGHGIVDWTTLSVLRAKKSYIKIKPPAIIIGLIE